LNAFFFFFLLSYALVEFATPEMATMVKEKVSVQDDVIQPYVLTFFVISFKTKRSMANLAWSTLPLLQASNNHP